MEKLLKRWAELEPGGLWMHHNRNLVRIDVDGAQNNRMWIDDEDPEFLMQVEYGVRQKIEARGWSWATGFRAEGGGGMVHWGRVMGHEKTAHKPAEALLSAYLEALENSDVCDFLAKHNCDAD